MNNPLINNKKRNRQKVVEFLKVVAEENRLKIIEFLQKKDHCVCEISQYFNLPQNLVSHHLKVMKNINLLTSKRVGQKTYYSLNKNQLQKYYQILGRYLRCLIKK